VPVDTNYKGDVRPRGLLQHEKDDVEFLLRSVTERHEEWLSKSEAARKASGGARRPLKHVDWEDLRGPSWTPDRDRMYHIARKEFARRELGVKRKSRRLSTLDDEENPLGENEATAVNQRLEIKDERQVIKRVLNADEWRYILHGDEPTKKRSESLERKSIGTHHHHQTSVERSCQSNKTCWTSSAAPSLNSSKTHTPEPKLLANELKGLLGSGSDTPSPERKSRSPSSDSSPPTGLQQRRNLKIPSIRTSATQRQRSRDRLSEADLGLQSSQG
jgi:hypothetical protein